jgi:hypothetical protein
MTNKEATWLSLDRIQFNLMLPVSLTALDSKLELLVQNAMNDNSEKFASLALRFPFGLATATSMPTADLSSAHSVLTSGTYLKQEF